MKRKVLTGLICIGAAASALAQGTVVFQNFPGVGAGIYVEGDTPGYNTPGTVTLALLWAPGTSFVPQNSLSVIGTYGPQSFTTTPIYFFDASTITTGPGTVGGTAAVFEVEGWTGSYASYAAAVAGGAKVGASAEFVNGTGSLTPPAIPAANLTGWDGGLYLQVVPEPSSYAVAALGVAGIWWHARRRK